LKTESSLIIFENWTLRIQPGSSRRILLLLHGWTGDENSMSIFTRNFPPEYWIISPRAPFTAVSKGFSWRAPAPQGTWPTIDLFKPAVEALVDLIDRWGEANDLETSSVDVAGFSQGGALTFTLGALYPEKFKKIGILAGFAPGGSEKIILPGLFEGKHFFVAHGTLDEMVPVSMAERMIHLIESAGGKVTYCESKVGHKLSSDCLKAFEYYLSN
jgi:phospholipase/carboxylesterase